MILLLLPQEVKSVPPFPESCFDQQNVVEITLFDFQNLDHQKDLNFRPSPSWNAVLRPSYKEAGLIYWRVKSHVEETVSPPANRQYQSLM